MVINNNPAYAYLLEGNSLVDQKMVMAHVYGARRLLQEQLLLLEDQPQDDRRDGEPRRRACAGTWSATARTSVEDFIDACLSLENLIDPMSRVHQRGTRRGRGRATTTRTSRTSPGGCAPRATWTSTSTRPSSSRRSARRWRRRSSSRSASPRSRSATCCAFLIEHAPLERWQRDVPRDRPRRGLLLRAAGADQDHERGLGHLLALARS